MSLSEDEITKLFTIRRTLMQMLNDRNYVVEDSDINMTREQYVEKYGDNMTRGNLTICKAKKNDSSDQIFVFFAPKSSNGIVTSSMIRDYASQIKSDKVARGIVVVQEKITASARINIFKRSAAFNIEVFQEDELLVNVTKHFLVPEHQVLTEEEKKTLLAHYSLKETQLPRIQVTDPIARYYGMKRGQVVRIIRSSETAGTYVAYRCAV